MADETRNAGNETEEPENPSTTESPEPTDDSREKSGDGDFVRVPKGEFASWKGNAERLNELERELRERREPAPAAPQTTTREDEDYWDEVRGYAADTFNPETRKVERGDPVAKALLAQRERDTESRERERKVIGAVSSIMEIADIEDRTERAEVKKLVMKGYDIEAARNKVRLANVETENKRLAAENAKLNQRRTDPDVVRTHEREVFASELKAKTKMPESQWDQRQAYLKSQGQFKQAMKEQGQLERGEVDLEFGR